MLVLCSSLLVVFVMPAHAQTATDAMALVIVIDNSGSMTGGGTGQPGNDEGNLRYAATRMLVDVADDFDQIGVLCFGDESQQLLPLEQLGPQDTRGQKLKQATAGACSASGGTVMHEGVKQATAMLNANPAVRKYMLVLTDGVPNIAGSTAGYDPSETITALQEAQQQGIQIIPVGLYRDQLSQNGAAQDFLQRLRQLRLEARTITDATELFAEFAEIYSAIKPDRYVALLGPQAASELQVTQAQQVNRLVFVLSPGLAVLENAQPRSCPGDAGCRTDVENEYNLLTVEKDGLAGVWRLSEARPAVVITRSNFRPAFAYPPTDDVTQTGYFIPRDTPPTLITRLDGVASSSDPITINNSSGTVVVAGSQTYLLNQFDRPQDKAAVKLGVANVPLVVSKDFSLAPVPDLEPDLPRLTAVNPDANGVIQVEPDNSARLQVQSSGNADLIEGGRVLALVVNTDTGQLVLEPQALERTVTGWQSSSLLKLEPGVGYRVLFWLDTVRRRDSLRYGDQLDLTFSAAGQIQISGAKSLTLEDFQQGSWPITVTVTEDRQADLQAHLLWTGSSLDGFTAQLSDGVFSTTPTGTTLQLNGLDDLCLLPEGNYTGQIEFTTTSGLSITPKTIPVSGSISYGAVKVETTEAVDLGTFCALPGWWGTALCTPLFGNESVKRTTVAVDVPTCVSPQSLDTQIESISPDDQAEIVVGEIDRKTNPIQMEIKPVTIPPTLSLTSRTTYVGRALIGTRNQPGQTSAAQFRYTKLSLRDVLTPWPFWWRPFRVGNLITTTLFGLGLIWMFGGWTKPAPRRKPKGRMGRQDEAGTRVKRGGSSATQTRLRDRVAPDEAATQSRQRRAQGPQPRLRDRVGNDPRSDKKR